MIGALNKQAAMERDIEKFKKYVKEVTSKLTNSKLQTQDLLADQQEACAYHSFKQNFNLFENIV